MKELKTIETDSMPAAIGLYTRGIIAGPLIFVSALPKEALIEVKCISNVKID